jgi:hypothetical protein
MVNPSITDNITIFLPGWRHFFSKFGRQKPNLRKNGDTARKNSTSGKRQKLKRQKNGDSMKNNIDCAKKPKSFH